MTVATSIRIPPLSCPLGSGLNTNVRHLNEAGIAWISQYRMFSETGWRRYVAMRPGYLPGYVMPNALRGPGLLAASNLLFWLWAYDDLECDEVHGRASAEAHILRLSELARIVETPAALSSGNPFVASLSNLRRQVAAAASPMQTTRWASAMQAYFLANTAVAIHSLRGSLPDLDSYVAQRIHSGAVKPTLMMLDVAEGYEVPAEDLESPDVWALNEIVCTLVGWDNDLLSYHKEVVRGGVDHNLLAVLAESLGCPVADALLVAVDMRERVMWLYLRLHAQTWATAGPELRRYLGGLSSWIRGHLDWGLQTVRYRDLDAGAEHPDEFAPLRDDLNPEPLPIASISWWWGRLAQTSDGGDDVPTNALEAKTTPQPRH
jgi:hypothetical protein